MTCNVCKCNPDSYLVNRINRAECRKYRNGIFKGFHAAVIVITLLTSNAVVVSASDIKISSKSPMKSQEAESREFLDNLNPSNLLDKIPKIQATVIDRDEVPHDKTFFGEDSNGHPIVVGTWFQYGSYTLAVAMFGTAFMVACAATAVYYVLFVVTEPSQSGRSMIDESNSSWYDANRILEMILIAYNLYDNQNQLSKSECQQRLLCEINERKVLAESSTMRKISNVVFGINDLLNWAPTSKTQTLKEAYHFGLQNNSSCSNRYSKCPVSLSKLI